MNSTLGARLTRYLTLPAASATLIEQGDLCFWDPTNVRVDPFSSQADQVGEELNQVLGASRFLGTAYSPSPDGNTEVIVALKDEILVHDYPVPSGIYRAFTLLGPSENSDGDGLLDQQLEAVTLFEEATHIVVDDSSSARTSVAASPIKSFAIPKPGVQGVIELDIFGWQEQDGTALAAFSDGASPTPGYAVADSEAMAIRWNNHANPDPIGRTFLVPPDADLSKPMTFHALVSKSGATVGDATTLTVTAFNSAVPGALHDADADYGGATDALDGDATAKTVTELTRTLAAADLPSSYPAAVSITVQPTDGLLGTDDLLLHATWIEYSKKHSA